MSDTHSDAKPKSLFWKLLAYSDFVVYAALWLATAVLAPRNMILYSGLGLSAITCVFWGIARRQIGECFTITAQAKRLVKTGLYRYFRHPIYLFSTLAHLGVYVALQNWWILGIWIVVVSLVQIPRIAKENKALADAFGDAFVEYRKATWI